MPGKLKVGIVGIGGIASQHVPGWHASDDADLVAGCDIDAPALERWGAEHGIDRLHTDVGALFADPEIDIVDICTPNRYHAPQAIAAMAAGKHVICENPLAPTPEEIRRMIAARRQSGTQLMAAQNRRFEGRARALKAEVNAGALGEVYHARGWYLRRAGVPAGPGAILKRHSGGGPAIDLGVHVLDLALWLMGNPRPLAVSGVARAELAHREGAFTARGPSAIPAEFDVEEFAAAFVRFENGATLILEVSWLLHGPDAAAAWLYGTRAGCNWPSCVLFETNPATQQHYDRELKLVDDGLPSHAQACVEFARAVAAEAPSPVPAEESLQVMAILDGIYRSQKTGREVRLD